jgi:hypothetical protein
MNMATQEDIRERRAPALPATSRRKSGIARGAALSDPSALETECHRAVDRFPRQVSPDEVEKIVI